MNQEEILQLRYRRLRAALRELSKPPINVIECAKIRTKLAAIEVELVYLRKAAELMGEL